jgi:peroxiredoxin
MMMNYLKFFLILLILIVIGCDQEKDKKEFGQAKPFSLFDTDSVSISLSDYSNKPVLIHFWADFCSHCRQEFPKIQRAYEKIKPMGYEILAINAGQTKEHVLEIKSTYGLTYPVLVDENRKTADLYGVTGLPSSYFIDAAGKIREKYIGYLEEQQILDIFKKIQDDS